jgi:hypothetical protein
LDYVPNSKSNDCNKSVSVISLFIRDKQRARREKRKVHPPLVMSPARDERIAETAWDQGGVVLGHDIHGDPWLWPDQVRVMQGTVLGMTGSGKGFKEDVTSAPNTKNPG